MPEVKRTETQKKMDQQRFKYLKENGWELNFDNPTMMLWVKWRGLSQLFLYAHFDDGDERYRGLWEKNKDGYCNLYWGDNENDVNEFSWIRLISMLDKIC